MLSVRDANGMASKSYPGAKMPNGVRFAGAVLIRI
jgi:hypothetical protein